MDGNEPFGLFLGAVALLAAFALIRRARRPSRPGAARWGHDGDNAHRKRRPARGRPGYSGSDSSRGPGSTDSGASDNDGAASGRD